MSGESDPKEVLCGICLTAEGESCQRVWMQDWWFNGVDCRFYPDLQWYVDVSLILIERGGEFASKEIWHSIVQLVTNYPQLHGYAAAKVSICFLRGLLAPHSVHTFYFFDGQHPGLKTSLCL